MKSENWREIDWESRTLAYVEEMGNDYHTHRKRVIEAMIPSADLRPGARIHDFGCGDASFLVPLQDVGSEVSGNDVSSGMVDVARKRLSLNHRFESSRIQLGGVECLAEFSPESIDGILALNVLAYLHVDEENEFYRQAQRVVKSGGWMLISHSNELFDLFTLNRYTEAFLANNLLLHQAYATEISGLLKQWDSPRAEKWPPLPLRENPLSYRFKLESYGFRETRQEFINRHEAPPSLLKRREFPDTLSLPESERWKLLFTCSTFASLAVRP